MEHFKYQESTQNNLSHTYVTITEIKQMLTFLFQSSGCFLKEPIIIDKKSILLCSSSKGEDRS